MINFILKILNFNRCTHPNVETATTLSYCPDCGKLIRINWYVVKCSCCGKKRIGIIRGNEIIPIAKFCTNCGTSEYEIEKIDSFNYFNMNYAIAKKEEENIIEKPEITESWVDEVEIINSLRFLPQHLN